MIGDARPDREIVGLAVSQWCWVYRDWIIAKEWRKPPNWVEGQRVALRHLWPKGKPFTYDQWMKWTRRMHEKYGGGDRPA